MNEENFSLIGHIVRINNIAENSFALGHETDNSQRLFAPPQVGITQITSQIVF